MATSMLAKSSVLSGRVATGSMRPAVCRMRTVKVSAAQSGPTWYPGATPPKHLANSNMLGNYGFDPLRLGTQPETLKWYQEAELMNGRWAMIAVAGILFTDLVGLPKWYEAGALDYAINKETLTIIEIAVLAIFEAKRYSNYKKGATAPGVLNINPFDPLNMNSEDMRLKELKNGRLAMLAFVGFASTAAVNGQTPLESLRAHLADPGHANIYTTSVAKETCIAVSLLAVYPMIVEVTKVLNKDNKESVPNFPWNSPWDTNSRSST